jgi:hypothetical protein
MDMEQLSKSQTVMLTLLVSFVTSIATGIVTVSLMEQAPPVVAQTVNRVIERTVETVSASGQTSAAATVVTQQKTVVVKESDLIAQAVQRTEPSIVRLYTSSAENSTFIGLGIVLDQVGTIVSDSSAFGQNADAVAVLSDTTRVRAFVVKRDDDTGLAFLHATSTSDAQPAWKPATLSGSQPLIGGTVVSLGGKSVTRIADGIITALSPEDTRHIIETNIASDAILPGSPIINTDGEVSGVSTSVSRASLPSGFVSAAALMAITE